jgi:hypothetical protein
MRIAPVSPLSAAIQVQALAAVEGALTAGLTDNAPVEAVAGARLRSQGAGQTVVADAPDTPVSAPPPPPADPAGIAVAQARSSAAVAQAGLAPMFADIAAALNAPATPPQLRAALANVLSLRTPIGADFSGPQLQQAVSQSGLMLEAKLAAGVAPGRDLKAALLTLAGALGKLAPPAAAQTAAQTPVQPLAQHAGRAPEAAAPPLVQPEANRAVNRPPPPFRDAALNPQRPEISNLPAVRSAEVAPRLAADVEQAVARQVLHQIASLPQGHDGPGWMFELPFLTAQGVTLAQFAIQRDEQGRGATPEGGPVWRARFAMEVDPLGPVHVDLRMGGAMRSHVTLWAGKAGLAQLTPEADLLGRTLDADVAIRPGAPSEAATPTPGRFVDRTS